MLINHLGELYSNLNNLIFKTFKFRQTRFQSTINLWMSNDLNTCIGITEHLKYWIKKLN